MSCRRGSAFAVCYPTFSFWWDKKKKLERRSISTLTKHSPSRFTPFRNIHATQTTFAAQNFCSSTHLQLKTFASQNICNSKLLELKTFGTPNFWNSKLLELKTFATHNWCMVLGKSNVMPFNTMPCNAIPCHAIWLPCLIGRLIGLDGLIACLIDWTCMACLLAQRNYWRR